MPDITCIINCCNHEAFIAEAIESCLSQNLGPWTMELIVVDDGSSDSTLEIVKSYGPQLTIVISDKRGQSGAINLALAQASGRFVAFCDGDDYLHPDRCRLLCEEFVRFPDVVLILNARHVFGPELAIEERLPEQHNVALDANSVEDLLLCSYGTSKTAVRREAIEKILPLPEVATIGADFCFMELLWIGKVSTLPTALTYYRVHQNNLFHTPDPQKQTARAEAVARNLASLRSRITKYPSYDATIAARYLSYFDMLLAEAEYCALEVHGAPTRQARLTLELKKLAFYRNQWSVPKRFYHYLRLPLIALLPPQLLSKLRAARS